MTVQVNNRQCVILVIISIFALKFQGLFSLIAGDVGRDGWFFLFIFLIVDLLLLLLAIRVVLLFPNKTLYEFLSESIGKVPAKIMMLFYAFFYLFKAIIPYKGINDLFGNVLFEELSWSIFSILLLITLFFMVSKGLKGIARIGEIFFWGIAVGVIGSILISIPLMDVTRMMPFMENGFLNFSTTAIKYNTWFGDFILLFLMMGKISKTIKLRWVFIWYAICGVIVILMYTIFYSLYENLAIYQNEGLEAITQFSSLSLDIGRIDKVFVLLSFVSTIIAMALYLFFSASCMSNVFNTKINRWFTFGCLVFIYVVDVIVISNTAVLIQIYENILGYISLTIHVGFTGIIFITAIIKSCTKKNMKNNIKLNGNNKKLEMPNA